MYAGGMTDFLAAMSIDEVRAVIPDTFSKIVCNANGYFLVYGTGYNPETAEVQKWAIDTQHHKVLYQAHGWRSELKCWDVVATW